MIQRLIRTAVCALGFTACDSSSTEPAPPPTEDSFAPGALSNYSVHSDQGNPWSLGSNTLEGNGGALQSVLIRNATPMTNGWVETLADSVDDGGLVLRFSDNEHYYLLAVRDDKAPSPRGQDNLEIYRRTAKEAGFVSLWRTNVTWPRGEKRRVRFEAAGDSLRVYLDAQRLGAVRDTLLRSGTGWGVRHYGASPTWVSRYRHLSWSTAN